MGYARGGSDLKNNTVSEGFTIEQMMHSRQPSIHIERGAIFETEGSTNSQGPQDSQLRQTDSRALTVLFQNKLEAFFDIKRPPKEFIRDSTRRK